jgi:excisionase family DNA binding protein
MTPNVACFRVLWYIVVGQAKQVRWFELKSDRLRQIEGGPLYKTAEVAEILKTSQRSVQRIIQRGELPVVQVGRRHLVLKRDLEAFIEARRGVLRSSSASS